MLTSHAPSIVEGSYRFGIEELYLYKLLRTRTLDKLIVASLLRHCDSDCTPHVRHVNLKALPKLHTRGLFLSSEVSAGFARAPLSEWQAGRGRMQTKVYMCTSTVLMHGTRPAGVKRLRGMNLVRPSIGEMHASDAHVP